MIPRLAAACCLVGLGGAASPLTPTAKWPLPTTYGVFNHSDHLILDASTGRIFASAKNIDVVFVINSTTGAVLHALSVPTPQGQGITRASAGGQRLLWVGSESDGVLRSFDADTFAGPVHTVDFSSDADDILIDDVTGDVLVAAGDDPAVLATVSASTGVVLSSISVPAHIEGFDFVRGTDLVVANIPDAGSIVVVLDRKNHSIATTITLPSEFKDQVPMAYNSRNQHLMLGVHDPPSLLVLDLARSGAQVFSAPAPVDLDDSACRSSTVIEPTCALRPNLYRHPHLPLTQKCGSMRVRSCFFSAAAALLSTGASPCFRHLTATERRTRSSAKHPRAARERTPCSTLVCASCIQPSRLLTEPTHSFKCTRIKERNYNDLATPRGRRCWGTRYTV